jgi:uncharacterized membrane protein
MRKLLHPISLLRVVGVLLCIFSYHSTRTFNSYSETFGVNLFRFRFGTPYDLSIYYTTAIGFAMLFLLNALRRNSSKARIGSMALSALGLFSLGNSWMEYSLGFSIPLTFMFPIVIASFEFRLIFWKQPNS